MGGLSKFFKFDEPTAGEIRRAKVLAVGGQRPRCKKGKACSAACIDPGESCLVEFPDPASAGLGKLSNKIEQLSLFDTSKYYTKEHIESVRLDREKTWKEVSDGVKSSLSSNSAFSVKAEYDKWRQVAVDFNKKLSEDRLAARVKPLKVPVKWEVYKAISERYDRAEKNITERMKKANKSRNKEEYDRQERRLIALYDKLGKKIGKTAPLKEFMWDKGPEPAPPLSSLKTEKQFKDLERKTDKLSNKMAEFSLEVARLLGITNSTYVDHEELYRNERDRDTYDSLRSKFMSAVRGKVLSFADVGYALYEYTLNSTVARDIRQAEKSGYKGPSKYEKMASDLNAMLRWGDMPKPMVEKYRGFRADSARLSEMISDSNAKRGFNHETMYSWSSSLMIGRDFADQRIKDLPDRDQRVIFRAVNRRGVPIEYVTENAEEYEMLTPGRTKYKHLGYSPIQVGGVTYHVFDVEEL